MKKVFIETLGCAMNVRDSEHLIAELSDSYSPTQNFKEADLIIINTCSVREKPVNKLFSELGAFNKNKKKDAKIGVCGCTASHLGEEIIKKAPFVDFVLGARNVSKISKVINSPKSVEIDINYDESTYPFKDFRSNSLKANINISIGCDKQCTFCIVPSTRGEEISIPLNIILDEVKRVVDSGAKEILLLGQNVNSYGKNFKDKVNFTKLLKKVSEVNGVERIRFTSPHPLHMDDEFLIEFSQNKKIAKSMHMPLQSGSSKILRDMKRGYTKEWFLDRALKLRKLVPDVAISTDIIVAFPNEDENDFLDTIDVMKQVKFNQIFSFIYSKRPNTKASEFENQIPKEVAENRLIYLQNLNDTLIDEVNASKVANEYEVLFEHFDDGKLIGRSDNNYLIKVKSDNLSLIGQIQKVKITNSHRHSLEATLKE